MRTADSVEQLYQRYYNAVYRICFLYMKNEADACDMVQETFLRLMKNRPSFENEDKAKAWLIVTASNCCKTQLGKWWRVKRGEYDEAQANAILDERSNEILQLVFSLDRKYSIPVYLYYFEGYTTGEIAGMLRTNASTIQTRLAKARKLLKMEIETDCAVSEGGSNESERL